MRFTRLLALAAIALIIGPNPMVAVRAPPRNMSQIITARPILLDPARPTLRQVGPLRILEEWWLDSANSKFGGYSALAILGPRHLLLGSDTGMVAGLELAPDGRVSHQFIAPLPDGPGDGKHSVKTDRDLESLTSDRPRGLIWAGYEHSNQIWRYSRGLARATGHVAPPLMRDWNQNGGAEAMARLSDGRFLVLAETSGGPGSGTDALLFAADPVAATTPPPLRFAYDAGTMGRVTDAAELPDGRVLLLHRKVSLWNGWTSTLAIADPRTIARGHVWRATPIARFAAPITSENFEGLAVEASPQGAIIWMISDDNLADWQRTLLLRMLLPGVTAANAGAQAHPGFTAVMP